MSLADNHQTHQNSHKQCELTDFMNLRSNHTLQHYKPINAKFLTHKNYYVQITADCFYQFQIANSRTISILTQNMKHITEIGITKHNVIKLLSWPVYITCILSGGTRTLEQVGPAAGPKVVWYGLKLFGLTIIIRAVELTR